LITVFCTAKKPTKNALLRSWRWSFSMTARQVAGVGYGPDATMNLDTEDAAYLENS
jgi:hypothetical protein